MREQPKCTTEILGTANKRIELHFLHENNRIGSKPQASKGTTENISYFEPCIGATFYSVCSRFRELTRFALGT